MGMLKSEDKQEEHKQGEKTQYYTENNLYITSV